MLLCLLALAFCWVELWAIEFGGGGLEVSVDNEVNDCWLLVTVLEGQLVLAFFWNLDFDRCWPDPTAFWLVSFQQILPGVAMEASVTDVLAMVILGLIIQQVIDVLDPGMVNLFYLFNQQEVDPRHIYMLLAEPVKDHTHVPPEYTECSTVLFPHPFDRRNGCWCVDPCKVQIVPCGIY